MARARKRFVDMGIEKEGPFEVFLMLSWDAALKQFVMRCHFKTICCDFCVSIHFEFQYNNVSIHVFITSQDL